MIRRLLLLLFALNASLFVACDGEVEVSRGDQSVRPTVRGERKASTPRRSQTPHATHSKPRADVHYVFPVQPPSVADYTQGHHDYPATDIFAPEGSSFVAVTNGMVEEVSEVDRWDPAVDNPATRGGLFVSLIGVDGVRYYGSHLATVAQGIVPGARVVAGDLLGNVGTTGNARGITPHLHFGISRATGPGDWEVRRGELDPFPYLEAWRKGNGLSPRSAIRDLEQPSS